jgi:hypothetical protein
VVDFNQSDELTGLGKKVYKVLALIFIGLSLYIMALIRTSCITSSISVNAVEFALLLIGVAFGWGYKKISASSISEDLTKSEFSQPGLNNYWGSFTNYWSKKTMKIDFIEDGNFKRWLRTGLLVVGLAIMFLAYEFVPPAPFGGFLLLVGLAIAAIGGYAKRAALCKIKPFDNSYKTARDSYKFKDDQDEK